MTRSSRSASQSKTSMPRTAAPGRVRPGRISWSSSSRWPSGSRPRSSARSANGTPGPTGPSTAHSSPRTWLTHRAPITAVGASKLVGMARLARKHEATGEALRSGDVSCAHVEVLAPMVRNREPEYARNETALLGAARVDARDDFGMVARHWRGIADDEMSKLDAREIHERRNLHVHKSLFGMGVLEGDLDADGTKILLKALDHCAPPDATGGPGAARSLAQRRADALVDICGAYLSGNGEGTAPVNLNVTMDHGTLTGAPPEDPRQVRCELEGFGPIPLATAFRLACDCSVTRVLDARRVRSPRPRPLHPPRLSRATQSVGDPRPRLRVPRLRPATRLVQRPPSRLVGTRRPHRRTEPLPAVSAPPHPLPRRRLGPPPPRRRHLPSPPNHPPATPPPHRHGRAPPATAWAREGYSLAEVCASELSRRARRRPRSPRRPFLIVRPTMGRTKRRPPSRVSSTR